MKKAVVQKPRQGKKPKAAAQATQAAKKNAKVVTTGGPRKPRDVIKRIEGLLHPESDLGLWGAQLARPFDVEGRLCPITYNPAPSFIQSYARTTHTNLNVSVALNTTTQYVLFPGHTEMLNSNQNVSQAGQQGMDAVAYHEADVAINGTTYVVGPMSKTDVLGTKSPIIGAVTSGLVLNQVSINLAGATSAPVSYDVALPYTSLTHSTTAGHHSRWMLNSMGVRIHNTTPVLSRGGTVVTVQPNNEVPAVAGNQAVLEVYPTFKDWGPGEDVELAWIPRAQDLAFWHGADVQAGGGQPFSTVAAPGIYIFLNNPTASAQSYSVEIVCHWNLSGTYLNPVGGPSPHAPEVKPVVEKALSFLQNNAPTASQVMPILQKAAQHSGFSTAGTFATLAAGAVKLASTY